MTAATPILLPRRSPTRPARAGSVLASLALALGALAAPSAAHEFWLVPETFEPPVGARVGVRIFVGDGPENGRAYTRNPFHIKEFKAIASTVSEIDGEPGADPAGSFTASGSGVLALVYSSHPSELTLPAERFESHLLEEGLEHVSRLRAAAGESDQPGTEAFSRCAKSLLRVAGAGPEGHDRRTGLELEIVPLSPPFTPDGSGELPILVLWRGQPLAGAQVRAFVAGRPEATVEVRTGDDGVAIVPLAAPGMRLLSVVHMERAEPGSGVDWRSTWSSLTFEVSEEGESPPLPTPPAARRQGWWDGSPLRLRPPAPGR